MKTIIPLPNQQATVHLAETIAPALDKRDIILLNGPLGSGKTFFTTHLCRFLGVQEIVNSPTFVLINRYQGKQFPIYHIDLYRLNSTEEALQLGIEELCEEGLIIIEWPEIIDFLFSEIENRSIYRLWFEYDDYKRAVTVENNNAI